MARTTTDGDGERTVSVDPGTQCLVGVPSMRSPLDYLPRSAFENLLVVSTTRPPSAVERTVRARSGDPENVGVVPVSGSAVDYDGPLWVADVVGPTDLTGVDARFADAVRYVEPGEGWVAFDNVNVLLMYARADNVYQLVSAVASRSRKRNARGVFAVVPGAVTESTHDRFREPFDAELRLARRE
ncbi:hypothetical protein G9464_15895 [Halostella sp. JP-L12]|uniref:DUF7504 family protein n=1 Tax=Halostella TaxID=1843185 RepID=UPI000EF766A0|nr:MULTISPECIES: hypothetical protein [Halostella]NHN49064.1 hypothetical protein [Halostella sp. JP-L12]